MKFTKENAYKELVAKMTAKGEKLNLSERSINEQLEKLIPLIANDETELADFIEKSLPFFKTADANVRNDISVGIKDYIDKNPKVEEPKPQEPKSQEGNEEMRKILERLEGLEKRNSELETAELIKQKKNEIKSYLKDKGVKNEDWISEILEQISISRDTEVQSKGDSLLGMYNKLYAGVEEFVLPGQAGGNVNDERLKDAISKAGQYAKETALV
jgi:hypothetical protein